MGRPHRPAAARKAAERGKPREARADDAAVSSGEESTAERRSSTPAPTDSAGPKVDSDRPAALNSRDEIDDPDCRKRVAGFGQDGRCQVGIRQPCGRRPEREEPRDRAGVGQLDAHLTGRLLAIADPANTGRLDRPEPGSTIPRWVSARSRALRIEPVSPGSSRGQTPTSTLRWGPCASRRTAGRTSISSQRSGRSTG